MLPLFTITQNEVRLSAATPVRIAPLKVEKNIQAHDHDYTEICIVEEGSATHHSESFNGSLKPGCVVIVPPGPAHAFENPRFLRVTNIYYLAEWFLWDLNLLWRNEGLVPLFFASHLFRRPVTRRAVHFTLTAQELQSCLYELNDIQNEYGQSEPSSFWIRSAFAKLLVILSRAWARDATGGADFEFRQEVWAALQAIDDQIKAGAPFCIEEFSRSVGLSSDAFSRAFRAATGSPPTEYFQLRRVQHAGHLLLRSQLSISQIAYQLGYADGAHLTRFFQKHRKCSPREFRKRYLSAELE